MPLPPELKTARAGVKSVGKGKEKGGDTANAKTNANTNANSTSRNTNNQEQTTKMAGAGGSFLTKYFLVILFGFAVLSMIVNNRYAHSVHLRSESNAVVAHLRNFRGGRGRSSIIGSGSGSSSGRFHNKFGNKFRFQQHSIQGPVGKIEVVLDDDNDDDDDNNNNNNEDPQTELPTTEADGEGEGHEQKTDPPTEKADKNEDENENENENNDDEGEGEGGDDDDDGGEIYAVKEAIADKPPTDPHGKQLWLEAKKKKAAEAIAEIQNRKQKHTHTIANLDCKAHGGPSEQDAEEMVYWEDIPEDALHMSPFHVNHPENQNGDGKQVQSITQFLTFEPDQGGWNNIRMAMETVLALAFAMGRTLVLPPHQGMYLIDKGGDHQNNKFSFDHFFHMESISAEHIGLDIITTKEFLERCVRGEIVNANGQPIHPPDGRTDWDGMPYYELKRLTLWMRKFSGQNLVDFVPEECIVSFPASNSEEDAEELAALPARIAASPEGFPPYEAYIGKPTPVDAPPIERLKEMNGDRAKLCLYTPDIQKKQWVHFPVGMKTSSGGETRLLVHFYAFLFFQDWKQDLWMKRFVRDHVRYIDEIQCAAARVVAKLRQRISDRTKGASNRFDTVHVRRGDFQFKETRVDADVILIQLKRVLDRNTTLYVATDERKKEFFKPFVDYFADVVFLDDFIETELQGINTNYFGMIDQLLASRGDIFFGCWFSTFTGYINRLRGYHADDHETPGYEQGIVPSYYYVMPDRFDHMQEFWPIKKQFYAREFPASWRLIDSSI
eukprot:CAMPEP_0172383614 /NCGR_PEP_ID=MMETSP1061-20121228/1479_1 /TAXON_ID=37318 /ORGANISM="Pseudo-nitzschia pungens, Strain cf. pungens" /LENGTH=780 /DNA_ID=CAMNT_0013111923 /DNA_START=163 /DNA_END=2505 /DNA_ORIENTATION=-